MQIEGFEELEKKLQKLAKDVDKDKQEPILEKAADLITKTAQNNAPVRDGLLKSSIYTKLMPRSDRFPSIAISAVDRRKAPHAGWVEFGISKMQAKPYFRKAWDEKQREAYQLIENELKSIVRKW